MVYVIHPWFCLFILQGAKRWHCGEFRVYAENENGEDAASILVTVTCNFFLTFSLPLSLLHTMHFSRDFRGLGPWGSFFMVLNLVAKRRVLLMMRKPGNPKPVPKNTYCEKIILTLKEI